MNTLWYLVLVAPACAAGFWLAYGTGYRNGYRDGMDAVATDWTDTVEGRKHQ